MQADEQSGLRGKVIRGSFWVAAFRWVSRLIGIANVAIIARILTPEDFGLVAMAMLVIGFIEAWLAFGLENACVQRRELDASHLNTAWSMRLIQGGLVTALVACSAPFAADYFRDERVTVLVWVLCSGIFIAGLGNIGVVLFRRELDFRSEFKLQFVAKVIGFVLGLAAAFLLQNYWALVIGTMAGIAATTILSYVLHPFRPRWDLSKWRELWGFSKWMFVFNIAQFAETRADEALVGRLGASEMGLYAVASDLGQTPVNEVAAPVNRVLFSAFSSVQSESERLRRAYLKTSELVATITVPAGVGLALVSDVAIRVLLGDNWLAAKPVLAAIAIFAVFRSLASTASNLFFATGRPGVVAGLAAFGLVSFLALSISLGVEQGAVGIALSRMVAGALAAALTWVVVRRSFGISFRDTAGSMYRPCIATACMAIVLVAMTNRMSGGPLITLLAQVAVGVAVYVTALTATWISVGRPDGPERELVLGLTKLVRRRTSV